MFVPRFMSCSEVSPANTPAGSEVSMFLNRLILCSEVSPANTPAGSEVSLFLPRLISRSEVSPANTPAGSEVSLFLSRFISRSEVSPAKSPAARAVMPSLFSSSTTLPPMTARCSSVTSAQATAVASLFSIRSSSASRTSAVRPQMPARVVCA